MAEKPSSEGSIGKTLEQRAEELNSIIVNSESDEVCKARLESFVKDPENIPTLNMIKKDRAGYSEGNSLHTAIFADRGPDVLGVLLDNGADPNIGDAAGDTAIKHASEQSADLTALILKKGNVNLDLQDQYGTTMITNILRHGNSDSVKIVLEQRDIGGETLRDAMRYYSTNVAKHTTRQSLRKDYIEKAHSVLIAMKKTDRNAEATMKEFAVSLAIGGARLQDQEKIEFINLALRENFQGIPKEFSRNADSNSIYANRTMSDGETKGYSLLQVATYYGNENAIADFIQNLYQDKNFEALNNREPTGKSAMETYCEKYPERLTENFKLVKIFAQSGGDCTNIYKFFNETQKAELGDLSEAFKSGQKFDALQHTTDYRDAITSLNEIPYKRTYPPIVRNKLDKLIDVAITHDGLSDEQSELRNIFVKKIFEKGANFDGQFLAADYLGAAMKQKNYGLAKYFLEQSDKAPKGIGKAYERERDGDYLIQAIKDNQPELVKLLISKGAHPDMPSAKFMNDRGITLTTREYTQLQENHCSDEMKSIIASVPRKMLVDPIRRALVKGEPTISHFHGTPIEAFRTKGETGRAH